MGSNWRLKSTFAMLAVAAMLALLGIYLVATQARDLAEARDALTEIQRRNASTQAATLYAEDAMVGILDFQTRLGALCAPPVNASNLKDFCRSADVLSRSTQALAERVQAPSSGDYSRVRSTYADLAAHLRTLEASEWQKGWLARAIEGIAYALMKSGDLDRAAAEIGPAVALDPDSAIVGLTALKIQCLRKAPESEVKASFAALRTTLDERIAAVARDPEARREDKRDAGLERALIDRDEELRYLCPELQREDAKKLSRQVADEAPPFRA